MSAIVAVLGVAAGIQATDLVKYNTPLNRGYAIISDNGTLTLSGRRVFQNISNAGLFPRYDRGVSFSTTDKLMCHLDGLVFLRGALSQYQTSFSGSLIYNNASSVSVASLDDSGNLKLRGALTTSSACTVPPYEPTLWNDAGDIQYSDNCYNYGNNQMTFTFAQPGRAAGYREWQSGSDMTVSYVRERALADGLTWVGWNYPGADYTCADGGHLVFMGIAPGVDYHWWRKDVSTSYWSHKPGGGSATNLDASGALITNPLASDRNFPPNYSENGGFYCTCGNNANAR